MNNKTLVLAVLCALTQQFALAQQDPLYNLYQFNQGMINPAYSGVYNNLTLNAISRLQWIGIDGSPRTNMFSASSSVANKFGAGLMVVSDQLGINNNQEVQLSFSYKVIEDDGKVLSFGLQGGLINYKYDYGKLNLEYIDDTDLDMNRSQYSEPNFGAGVWYMTDLYYVGVSSPRILNVDVNDGMTSSTRYQRHFYVSGGMIINNSFNSTIRLKPSFLLRWVPNGNMAADLNLSALLMETIWAGVTLRNFSSVGLNGQFQVANRFRIGYGFELPMNSLINSNFGTHELSILMELSPLKTQRKVMRYF
jgi:type IX secretion system PorP/SprF family membrane protein